MRVLLVLLILGVQACGKSPTPSEVSRAPDRARAELHVEGSNHRWVEPRYLVNGEPQKFWAYGDPFRTGMQGGSYLIHQYGICVLLSGPGSEVVRVQESKSVPLGEWGVIVSNRDSTSVDFVGSYRFERYQPRCYDAPPFPTYCEPEGTEHNFFITEIVCRKGNSP